MKKFILPILLPVILFFIVKAVNPAVQPVGIGIIIFFGLMIGLGANSLLFKAKSEGENVSK